MAIEFTFTAGSDRRLAQRLRGGATRIEQAVMAKMNQLDVELQRLAQSKLEGGVLHSHTHKLANSVRVIPAVKEGTVIVGRVQAAGGPAWYGRVQELGAHIPEVTGKLMVFPGGERRALISQLGKGMVGKILGRSGGMVFTTRHRAFDLPPRPFMSTSLEEMKPRYIGEIQATIAQVLGAGKGE